MSYLPPFRQPDDCFDIPESESTEKLLELAIDLLAGWVEAVKNNGAGWDDWDEHYKDACYRPGPLRGLIDAKVAKIEEYWKS